MIAVKLREGIEAYRERTGERMTYVLLAARTGIARATLESIASRPNYNTRLSTVEKLCRALHCQPGDLLELAEEGEDGDQ